MVITELLPCALLLLLVHPLLVSSDDASELAASIIPPWLDSYGTTPNISVRVSFNGTLVSRNGLLLTLMQTSSAPRVEVFGPDFQPNAGYTFIIVDPDAFTPATPITKNIVHWIISNIRGSTLPSQDIAETGTVVLHYLPPRKPTFYPPPYGVHRYYNLLFQQASRREDIQNVTTPSPSHFSTRNFTQRYRLGYPVAGVVFRVNLDA